MCGITGIICRKKKTIPNKAIIERMLRRIVHRGPDDTGICDVSLDNRLHSVQNVAEIKNEVWGLLGFNRLSIQDITSAGHQPMLSPNKNIVIMPSMSKRGMVNMKSFENRLKNIAKNENTVVVWKYINMKLWLQSFVDGRTGFYTE